MPAARLLAVPPLLASALSYQEQKQQKALERKRQNDLAKIEGRIDEIEQRIKVLDEMMADEAICTDVTRLMEITQEKEKLDGQLLTLMEQWETLSNDLPAPYLKKQRTGFIRRMNPFFLFTEIFFAKL